MAFMCPGLLWLATGQTLIVIQRQKASALDVSPISAMHPHKTARGLA
jgi:hypothetical protein